MSSIYVTYLTIYTGNKLPMFYIGSSTEKKVLNGYHGSVSSKQYKQIWQEELKTNPHLFKTKIISKHNTDKEAREKELYFQKCLNIVKSNLYINKSLSRPNGFFGMNTSGKNHPRFGFTNSNEHRNKISNSTKGRIPWNKGKTGIYSKNTLLKISNSKLGKTPWNKGKTKIYDAETLNKIKRSKNWRVISPIGQEYVINDLASFCKNNNLKKHSMYRLASGQIKNYQGWKCYSLV